VTLLRRSLPVGNYNPCICAMRKLPVVPNCRSRHVL